MVKHKSKNLPVATLEESLPYLSCFKNILLKIKYTGEVLSLVKLILKGIVNIAFIPVFYIAIYLILRRLWVRISVLSFSGLSAAYITNYLDYIAKIQEYLFNIKESLKSLSLRFHNYLFDGDLVSKTSEIKEIEILMNEYKADLDHMLSEYKNSISQMVSSPSLDASVPTAVTADVDLPDVSPTAAMGVPQGTSDNVYSNLIEYLNNQEYLSNVDWTLIGAIGGCLFLIGSSYFIYTYGT